MDGVVRIYIFLASLFLCLSSSATDSKGLGGQQSLLLKHAVKTLLGFEDLPDRRGYIPSPEDMGAASRYMLDLYNRHKDGAITKGRFTGNTVRSIHANIGEINGERVFLFNLSSIKSTENVFSGELHYYKAKKNNQKTNVRMLIYEVAPTYMTQLKSVHVNSRAIGWQSLDVTSAVQSCLSSMRNKPHILAMAFIAEKVNGAVDTVSVKKFMRYLSMPFLIVFANETQTLTMDHMKPHFQPEGLSEALTTGNKIQGENERTYAVSSADIYHENKQVNTRQKRSILDNKIPEEPKEMPMSNVPQLIPDTRPYLFKKRRQKHKENTQEPSKSTLSTFSPVYEKENTRTIVETRRGRKKDPQLLPPAEFYQSKNREEPRRRRHRGRRRNSRRRRLPLPKVWQRVRQRQNLSGPKRGQQKQCGRRKLYVDFKDIGWGDWIISPKSFAAHYCAGQCQFPLRKGSRPSNHAIIQSIVNAVGIQKGIPAPCCVPDVMSSVTLLYFDENQNVVLKNYPEMSVETCTCR